MTQAPMELTPPGDLQHMEIVQRINSLRERYTTNPASLSDDELVYSTELMQELQRKAVLRKKGTASKMTQEEAINSALDL